MGETTSKVERLRLFLSKEQSPGLQFGTLGPVRLGGVDLGPLVPDPELHK